MFSRSAVSDLDELSDKMVEQTWKLVKKLWICVRFRIKRQLYQQCLLLTLWHISAQQTYVKPVPSSQRQTSSLAATHLLW